MLLYFVPYLLYAYIPYSLGYVYVSSILSISGYSVLYKLPLGLAIVFVACPCEYAPCGLCVGCSPVLF